MRFLLKKKKIQKLRHIRIFWLLMSRMSRDMKIARHFVHSELGSHSTALAVVDISLDRVVYEADLVTTQIVLNINSEDYYRKIIHHHKDSESYVYVCVCVNESLQSHLMLNIEMSRVTWILPPSTVLLPLMLWTNS